MALQRPSCCSANMPAFKGRGEALCLRLEGFFGRRVTSSCRRKEPLLSATPATSPQLSLPGLHAGADILSMDSSIKAVLARAGCSLKNWLRCGRDAASLCAPPETFTFIAMAMFFLLDSITRRPGGDAICGGWGWEIRFNNLTINCNDTARQW